MDLKDLIDFILYNNASELHLNVGKPPALKIAGKLLQSDFERLAVRDARFLVYSILTPEQQAQLEEEHELELFYTFSNSRKFRVKCLIKDGHVSGEFVLVTE